MRGFSFRLTHKIVAIGVAGIAGVILVGGMHVYGESEMAVYRDTAENARTISELSSKIEIELLEGRRPKRTFCSATILRRPTARSLSENLSLPTSTCFTAKSSRPAGLTLPVRPKLC